MNKFLRFCTATLIMSIVAAHAKGDIVVTTPLDTAASAQIYGYESYDDFTGDSTGLLDQSQTNEIFGNGSVSAGFAFDSGAGLTGTLSSNQWATESHGPHNLLFSAAGNQNASLSNLSSDGFTSAAAVGSSVMRFSVGESGQAVLSFHGMENFGSSTGSFIYAHTISYIEVYSINGPPADSYLEFDQYEFSGGSQESFLGYSSTDGWSGGDTVTLDLTPGSEYQIFTSGAVIALFPSNGSIDDLSGAYDATVSVSTIPAPSSFVMSTILLGMLGVVAAYRRAKPIETV